MISKSLMFDVQLLLLKEISILQKLRFIVQKYIGLLKLAFGSKARVSIGGVRYEADSVSSLGTFQSNIIDFYHEIVTTGVIKKSKPVILDLGANTGQFSAVAKIFYPNAIIHSFEPDPLVFQQLEKNFHASKNVHLYNYGLSNKEETLKFYVHPLSIMSSFKKYDDYQYGQEDIKKLHVKPLDSFSLFNQEIDLLKIDVEGYEQKVLNGSLETMKVSKYILVELSLKREQAEGTNLAILSLINKVMPKAAIIKTGRALGLSSEPTCQDFLIRLLA